MPLNPSGAAARLRRTWPLAAASALALALPAGTQAADGLGAGGVTIPGSAMVVGVSGAVNQAGKVSARFSAVDSPLFWGPTRTTMNDGTSAVFALNTPSGLYSALGTFQQDNQPFTQTSAPIRTGTGTAGDPYVVTSQFRATASVDVTQTVTHVSGTTRFTTSWAVHNGSASATAFQAFEGADLYVDQNDNGTGAISGTLPNRQIGSVASDGTVGYLVEQASSPWSHYFSGANPPFYGGAGDSNFGSLPDAIDPTFQDSGEAVEWDFNLAAGATKTLSVQWSFTAPAAPQAPLVTATPSGTVRTTTAAPHFLAASGDTQVVGFQCSLDGDAWATCTSPSSASGLADGVHTYAVRATNSAGLPGPSTTRTWTVDTTPPAAPAVTGAPSGTVAADSTSLTLTGEVGATFRCSVDGGAYATCTSPLALAGLADGHHAVSVKQIDAAGNGGTLVTTASWTVDTTVPAAPSVDGEPAASTTATDARVAFTTPAGLTAECSLDGAGYQACASPVDVTGLSVGTHTLQLRMVNAAGTAGAARTVTWQVQAPPVTTPTPAATQAPAQPSTPTPPAIVPPTVTTPAITTPPIATPATTTAQTTATAPGTTAAAPAAPAAATPARTVLAPVRCVSRRTVTVHWKLPVGAKAGAFTIVVDGKAYKRVSGKARAFTLSLAGRPASSVKVEIRSADHRLATRRVYKTCTGRAAAAELPAVVLKRAA